MYDLDKYKDNMRELYMDLNELAENIVQTYNYLDDGKEDIRVIKRILE